MTRYANIAVLLTTHNGGQNLKSQLATLLKQMKVNVHIFVSDDGSSDCTLEIVREFALETGKVTIINSVKTFGSSALNFYYLVENVDVSKFDFVAFSDQDDVWFENKLYESVKQMRLNQCVGYSADVIAYWPQANKKKLVRKSGHQRKYDHIFEPPGPGCTHVLSRVEFQGFQGFVQNHRCIVEKVEAHDWLIYAYFRESQHAWFIHNVPQMFYVQHGKNAVGANYGLSAFLTRLKKVNTGWYHQQVALIMSLFGYQHKRFCRANFILKNITQFRRNLIQSILVAFLLFIRRA